MSGIVHPGTEKAPWSPYSCFPVPKGTRDPDKDFLQGHRMRGQRGMASSWNRVGLDLILERNYFL